MCILCILLLNVVNEIKRLCEIEISAAFVCYNWFNPGIYLAVLYQPGKKLHEKLYNFLHSDGENISN